MTVTKLTTPALKSPVSVQDLRDYGRIDDDNDADILQRNIDTAVALCENQTGQSFITKTYTISTRQSRCIEIINRPLIDIITIRDLRATAPAIEYRTTETYDVSGGDSNLYAIEQTRTTPMLHIDYSITLYPDYYNYFDSQYTYGGGGGGGYSHGHGFGYGYGYEYGQIFEIDYTAGYGESADDVPADIKEAILSVALNIYEERGKMGSSPYTIAPNIIQLLQRHRSFNKVV